MSEQRIPAIGLLVEKPDLFADTNFAADEVGSEFIAFEKGDLINLWQAKLIERGVVDGLHFGSLPRLGFRSQWVES